MQNKKKILFISHDASRTGAPIVLLHHLKGFKNAGVQFDIMLKGVGELLPEFENIARVYCYNQNRSILKRAYHKIINKKPYNIFFNSVFNNEYDIIYGNTVVTADGLMYARKQNPQAITICHVHELNTAIKTFFSEARFREALPYIDHFVAASNAVKKMLINDFSIPADNVHLHYEHIPLNTVSGNNNSSQLFIQKDLKICGSGTLDWRKGIDLFIQTAFLLDKDHPDGDFHFYWIGGSKSSIDYAKMQYDITNLNINHRITHIDNCDNPLQYMKQCDLFLLTSREDPFPLVCLEAASLGKPIICFKKSGGMEEFVTPDNGWLINYLDIPELVTVLSGLLPQDKKMEIEQKGKLSKMKVQDFDIQTGVRKLHEYLNSVTKRN